MMTTWNKNSIVAFGNPLLDVTLKVEDDILLKKYDIKSNDQKEISKDDMLTLLKDIRDYKTEQTPGGCSQNTLRILKWINKSTLACIVGSVGDDNNGQLLKELLQNAGVETSYIVQANKVTGNTVALVGKGHRALLAHLGAAEHMSLSNIKSNSEIINLIKSTKLVYIESFFLTNRLEATKFIIELCNQYEKPILMNISGQYLFNIIPRDVQFLVEQSNFIFGNKSEFIALAKYMQYDVIELAFKFTMDENKDRILVITDEENDVILIQNGKIEKIPVSPVEASKIKDTIGAGDAFVGGYVAGLLTGLAPI